MTRDTKATDLIVSCTSQSAATALDETVQALPGVVAAVVDGSWDGKTCRVRVFGDTMFIRFAFEQQGYGQIIGEEPVT